jgi:hypothetical protein
VTDAQREILLHTLGLTMSPKGLPHRNYFNSAPGDDTYDDLEALVGMGYMQRGRATGCGSFYFSATAKGVQAAVGLRVPSETIAGWLRTGKWAKARL